jgi:hypothetical protein
MDTNVMPVTERSDISPASPLETMHEAVHRAQAIFLRDLTARMKACGEALEQCVDELEESRLSLSADVFKTWRAADKHFSQLIGELEAECADLTEQSSG